MGKSLPETLRHFAEHRIAAGEFEDLDTYFASLVAADQQALHAALIQGLASGEAGPLDMCAIRARARALFETE